MIHTGTTDGTMMKEDILAGSRFDILIGSIGQTGMFVPAVGPIFLSDQLDNQE